MILHITTLLLILQSRVTANSHEMIIFLCHTTFPLVIILSQAQEQLQFYWEMVS